MLHTLVIARPLGQELRGLRPVRRRSLIGDEDDDCADLAKDGHNTVGWYVTGKARPRPH
jgi:hypothetical protein